MTNTTTISNYAVYSEDGELICVLNEALAKKQGITEMGLVSLKVVHRERYEYIKKMQECSPDDRAVLQWLNKKVIECDSTLQMLWHFPVDANYHRWWEVPHCNCPQEDNQENYGTPYRVINLHCPIHGNQHEADKTV